MLKKDYIYNFKSLLVVKNKFPFSVNNKYNFHQKIIRINNCKYLKKYFDFKLIPYKTKSISLITNSLNKCHKFDFLIKHSIFNFYIKKYKIQNKYVIENIEEIYRLTKVFVQLFNQKYSIKYDILISNNHDVIFTIILYNENKITDIEKYKKEKVENIFNKTIVSIIRRL